MTKGARVYLLDLLRVIAVIMVALFHFGYRGTVDQPYQLVAFPALASVGKYGFLGVELFFIISGYVILYSVQGRSLTEFAIARMVRLYPTFWLCCAITTVIVLAAGQELLAVGPRDFLLNLPIVTARHFGTTYVDGAYWSLQVEIQFYVLVALLYRFTRDLAPGLLIWSLGCIAVIGFEMATGRGLPYPGSSLAGYFAVGAAIYMLRERGPTPMAWLLLGAGLIASLARTYLSQVEANAKYDSGLSLPICLAVVLLSAVAVYVATGVDVRSKPMRKALMFAGGLTYPFYLLHQNIGYTGINLLSPAIGGWAALAASLLGLVILSALVYQYFDIPVRRGLKSVLDRVSAQRTARADLIGVPEGSGPGAEVRERQL